MKLPEGTLKYLLIGQAVIPFFINVAVNVILGAIAFGGRDSVTTWALDKGAAGDSIGTCFFLPFITCLIATPLVRRNVADGVAASLHFSALPKALRAMSGPTLLRAFKFGIVGLLFMAGPVYLTYCLLAGAEIETVRFITIKALFAGVFGVFVTPLIAIVAMADAGPD